MTFPKPAFEKEYSMDDGLPLTLKIWFPKKGAKVELHPISQKGVGVPITFPIGYLCQEQGGSTVYRSLYPYEIERHFCGWNGEWKEGQDFWDALKARQLVS